MAQGLPTLAAVLVSSALLLAHVLCAPALAAPTATVAVAQAARDQRATEPLPPIAGDEIRALEQQVQIILTEARRQQVLLATQRDRLTAAEAANAWLPWLLLGLVGLGAVVVWLALRLRRVQRGGQRQPRLADSALGRTTHAPSSHGAEASGPLASDLPLLSTGAAFAAASAQADLTVAQPRLMAGPTAAHGEATLAPHDFNLGSGVPPRPVSVEELLDLDQQVDFFLVLGQAQSAIDLLLGHVRGTGGTSALPYFKLLEIYREQGDEEAYERTRERFNQRFNAHAPDCSGDLASGRVLEDYPEVVARLQRAWPQPMRAVAELEGLLLRRADLEPFDMPAYRDVLMLHALVRDLPAAPVSALAGLITPPVTTPSVLTHDDRLPSGQPAPESARAEAHVPGGMVDLLLPLGEGPMDITAPRQHLSERGSAQAMLADWVFTRAAMVRPPGAADSRFDHPPAPASRPMKLDLDLSDFAPAPREFTRPAAFTDIDMRRDSRMSDLGGLDEIDSDPSQQPSRS